MPLNWPTPSFIGEQYTYLGNTWVWDGQVWKSLGEYIPGPTGPVGPTGSIGPTGPGGASGSYSYIVSNTTQTNGGTASANLITYDSIIGTSDITQSSGAITFTKDGEYSVQFSGQFNKGTAGAQNVNVWLSLNGTNVPDSRIFQTVSSTTTYGVYSREYLLNINNGDNLSLYWSSTDPAMSILAFAGTSGPDRPAQPSVSVTIHQITSVIAGPTGPGGIIVLGSGSYSAVREDVNNGASGPYSGAFGGQCNQATACYGVVVGGFCNTTSGSYSFTGAGYCNTTSGSYSFTGNGFCNTTSGYYAFTGSGYCNTTSGACAFTGSGRNNTTSGGYAFTGAGYCNTTSGRYAFTGSGCLNRTCRNFSNIVGGEGNVANTLRGGIIGAGTMNYLGSSTTLSSYSSYNDCIIFTGDVTAQFNVNDEVYGYNNADNQVRFGCVTGSTYSAPYTTVCTTQNFGTASAIVVRNLTTSTQCGCNSFIGGGSYNSASCDFSVSVGGNRNSTSGAYSFTGGGCSNTVSCYGSSIVGGSSNTISGFYSFIGGGFNQTVSGNYASSVSGYANSATAEGSFVGGGGENISSGLRSFTGSGFRNITSGCHSFTGSGCCNSTSGCHSFTGSGFCNTTSGNCAFTGSGYCNTTSGAKSFTGSGRNNTSSGVKSVIVGGRNNIASGAYSFTGGGTCNTASANGSFTGGGGCNTTSGPYAFTGSGCLNRTCSNFSSIVGGHGNVINSCRGGTIGGGTMNYLGSSTTLSSYSSYADCIIFNGDVTAQFNTNDEIYGYNNNDNVVRFGCVTSSTYSAPYTTVCITQNFGTSSTIVVRNLTTSTQCGCNSFIGGGSYNSASGNNSVSVGGFCNTTSGINAFTGSGKCNTTSGDDAFTGSGYYNTTSGVYAFTGSGQSNTTIGNYAFTGNGVCNTTSGCRAFTGSGYQNITSGVYAFTGNGACNTTSGNYAFTGSGALNTTSGDFAFTGNGRLNRTCRNLSNIVGGDGNVANSCRGGAIVSGTMNYLGSSTVLNSSSSYNNCIIFGGDETGSFNVNDEIYGYNNSACEVRFGCVTGSSYSGGYTTLCTTQVFGTGSVIAVRNLTTSTISGCNSFIGGGSYNSTGGRNSATVSGYLNTTSGCYAFTGSGELNSTSGRWAFTGGGCLNSTSGWRSFTGAGRQNTTSGGYSFTGSGRYNITSGLYSVIAGGNSNTASGLSSFIGGGDNNVMSCNFSGGFGCGITSQMDCAFHVNRLWVGQLPGATAGLPSGALWYDPATCVVKYIP